MATSDGSFRGLDPPNGLSDVVSYDAVVRTALTGPAGAAGAWCIGRLIQYADESFMLISIDHHSGVPVYRQLMDQIKFHIASGLLKPGDELPSTRVLSAQLGVNPMTISKSYSFLEKEQVVERRRGMRLVVRALDAGEARSNKLDQLRLSLASSVTIARQCGIENTEAVGVFNELLQAPEASDGRDQ